MLVEVTVSLFLLMFTAIYLLQTNMETLKPRNWAIVQTLTDAYLTEHEARAESMDFEELVGAGSLWPEYPDKRTDAVTIATLPRGRVLTGTLVRTRIPSSNNLVSAGGNASPEENPGGVETWTFQSHLTYTARGKEYIKSRNVIRTR